MNFHGIPIFVMSDKQIITLLPRFKATLERRSIVGKRQKCIDLEACDVTEHGYDLRQAKRRLALSIAVRACGIVKTTLDLANERAVTATITGAREFDGGIVEISYCIENTRAAGSSGSMLCTFNLPASALFCHDDEPSDEMISPINVSTLRSELGRVLAIYVNSTR